MQERRTDVGLKLIYVILTAIITLMLSVFFNKTYETACAAERLSYENKKDIAVIQQCFTDVERRLTGMDGKLDVLIGIKK
jgi:hypothetical protein